MMPVLLYTATALLSYATTTLLIRLRVVSLGWGASSIVFLALRLFTEIAGMLSSWPFGPLQDRELVQAKLRILRRLPLPGTLWLSSGAAWISTHFGAMA